MNIKIKEFNKNYLEQILEIWNHIISEGIYFPYIENLDRYSGLSFFLEQSFTGVAYREDNNEVVGLYILHPNSIGRCGHIANASYAVKDGLRGQHIGEQLVLHSIKKTKDLGFGILQFNAVLKSNYGALYLYKKLGFKQLGIIPNGFLMKDGNYEDIIPHYIEI